MIASVWRHLVWFQSSGSWSRKTNNKPIKTVNLLIKCVLFLLLFSFSGLHCLNYYLFCWQILCTNENIISSSIFSKYIESLFYYDIFKSIFSGAGIFLFIYSASDVFVFLLPVFQCLWVSHPNPPLNLAVEVSKK